MTEKCFLQYYCEYIHAFETKFCAGKSIPLVIMTSEDTHSKTLALLETNKYFGLRENQVFILNQEKVPTMVDNEGRFGVLKDKPLI